MGTDDHHNIQMTPHALAPTQISASLHCGGAAPHSSWSWVCGVRRQTYRGLLGVVICTIPRGLSWALQLCILISTIDCVEPRKGPSRNNHWRLTIMSHTFLSASCPNFSRHFLLSSSIITLLTPFYQCNTACSISYTSASLSFIFFM